MNRPDDEPRPELNWEQLESQFEGAEERAQAVRDNQVHQTARDIKAFLHAALPAEIMQSFEPAEPTDLTMADLPLGADGQPIIRCPEDAYLVAKARPEVAALMAHSVRAWTAADRQQLAVDIERARTAGDTTHLHELGVKQLELEAKAKKLEFFVALATLHPMSNDYKNKFLTVPIDNAIYASERTNVDSLEKQVGLLISLDKVYQKLERQLREYSPGVLEAMQVEAEGDARYTDYVKHLGNLSEDRAVSFSRVHRILSDMIEGRASVFSDTNSTAEEPYKPAESSNLKPELLPFYAMLKQLPGIDPVAAILDERYPEVPQSGWFITARVTPGSSGEVDVYRVNDGGYSIHSSFVDDSLTDTRLSLALYGGLYANTDFVYKKFKPSLDPSFKDSYGPYTDATELSDGKFLLTRDSIMRGVRVQGKGGTYLPGLVSSNLDAAYRYWPGFAVDIARITDAPEQAQEIIEKLCAAMGMNEAEAQITVSKLVQREVFEELKTEAYKDPGPQDVTVTYKDGTQKIVKDRRHESYEDDQSGLSASGLYYDGLIPYYPE